MLLLRRYWKVLVLYSSRSSFIRYPANYKLGPCVIQYCIRTNEIHRKITGWPAKIGDMSFLRPGPPYNISVNREERGNQKSSSLNPSLSKYSDFCPKKEMNSSASEPGSIFLLRIKPSAYYRKAPRPILEPPPFPHGQKQP